MTIDAECMTTDIAVKARYRYWTCDVFTDTRFGGNQLAVLPEAEGLSERQMLQIAREFNFAETAFVLPPERGHTRRVRIFTTSKELSFAGHPNIGTAFVLAAMGAFGPVDTPVTVTFEELAGLVPIVIRRRGASFWCELSAPELLSLGPTVPADLAAAAVSLVQDDVVTTTHPPRVTSVGAPFLMVELRDRAALARARVHPPAFESLTALSGLGRIHLYVRSGDEVDLRCRVFVPFEDAATGSANCALVGLLGHCDSAADGSYVFRIAQGVEMGRPSLLEGRAEKRGGAVVATRIGGSSVMVSQGLLEVEVDHD